MTHVSKSLPPSAQNSTHQEPAYCSAKAIVISTLVTSIIIAFGLALAAYYLTQGDWLTTASVLAGGIAIAKFVTYAVFRHQFPGKPNDKNRVEDITKTVTQDPDNQDSDTQSILPLQENGNTEKKSGSTVHEEVPPPDEAVASPSTTRPITLETPPENNSEIPFINEVEEHELSAQEETPQQPPLQVDSDNAFRIDVDLRNMKVREDNWTEEHIEMGKKQIQVRNLPQTRVEPARPSQAKEIKPVKIVWKTKFTAHAHFKSYEENSEWLASIKNPRRPPYYTPPYNQLVFDRDDDHPECMTFRVALGAENAGVTIADFLAKVGLPCEGVPAPYSIEHVLEDTSRVYTIDQRPYRITNLISDKGCYGDVYKALDLETGDEVAIKVLRHEEDHEAAEMQKMDRRGGHPNIVNYITCGPFMDKFCIVMEYIDGKEKWQVENEKRWTPELERQYQAALKFMRESGVVSWRENDRENVLVRNGVVKLIDFGTLARN